MHKKKLVFLSILSSVLLLGLFSNCYATLSDSLTYKEINYNGTRLEAFQSVWQLLGYSWEQSNPTSANNQLALVNIMDDYDYFIIIHYKTGNDYIKMYFSNNSDYSGTTKYSKLYRAYVSGQGYQAQFSDLQTNNTGYSISVNSNSNDYVLKYVNGKWYEYSVNDSTIVNDSFEFEPNYDAITSYNGYNQLYTKKYDYSINNWLIGNLTLSENYKIYDIRLLNVGGQLLYQNTYNSQFSSNTNNNFFISSTNNNLYIRSYLLSYRSIYTIIIYPKDSQGNISDNNFVGTFMYLPLNAEISGDSINNFGSGDYTPQDSVVDLSYLLTNTDATPLNSGDISSFAISIGEESGEKLGQTKEFFTWVLTEFKNVLENNSNTTLDIPIYTTHNEVRSDFFVLPNGILRTFISAGWWFIVGVPFIKYIRRTIQKIKGGDIPNSDEKSDLLGNIL